MRNFERRTTRSLGSDLTATGRTRRLFALHYYGSVRKIVELIDSDVTVTFVPDADDLGVRDRPAPSIPDFDDTSTCAPGPWDDVSDVLGAGPSVVEDRSYLYAFLQIDQDNLPITWEYGGAIRVALHPSGMGDPHFIPTTLSAIRRINDLAAFDLRLVDHDADDTTDADIHLRWVDSAAGLGASASRNSIAIADVTIGGAAGGRRIIAGDIRIHNDVERKAGFVPGGWGPIILHELLHCLGAGHCENEEQIMHPHSDATAELGIGDRLVVRMLSEAAFRKGVTS